MRRKKYRLNYKVKRMFKFKGAVEATQLAQNFVRYITNPFIDQTLKNELIDHENEIYMSDIISDEGAKYTIAISTQLDYQEDAERVKELVQDYVDNDLDFIWYTIGDKIDIQENQFFESIGLVQNDNLIGMIMDVKKWKKQQKKVEDQTIKFRRVNNKKRLNDFSSILKAALGPKSWDYLFYKTLLKLNKDDDIAEIDLLYKNDQPAVTGNIYFEKDLVIIDDIATHPDFRHQGLAKKMINHLLHRAVSHGYDLVGLIATPQGYNLYRKMGFRPIKLYLTEYVTKTSKSNLEQIATKISKGKLKKLQVVKKDSLLAMVNDLVCENCQEKIEDPQYITTLTNLPNFSINNYHKKCYHFSAKERWVVISEQ
ncbi:GNAT family N-acetyltransferase [Spiroplasma chrysopicola]|uniref:N-acetyltransferase domain-containing protein n=1 Tax=Spiroplasma chrysopicola DF-1 TaxID=1276227 RepID=R4UFJ1_9MOLU|nr:GNAT family N-acetyltransferase [Spiroplasma chrysopicola]AGM24925.1 hypothetical protein SCHRY_v1c03400 [Spiroplasma chrysopicola DF-1]